MKQLTNTDKQSFWGLKSVFQSPEMDLVFQSILQDYTPGETFINDLENPTIFMIWDRRNSLYFSGESIIKQDYIDAILFAKNKILAKIVSRENCNLKISYSSETWERMLRRILFEMNPKLRDRYFYQHLLNSIPEAKPLEKTIEILEISKDLLEKKQYKNSRYVIEEIKSMWGNIETFYEHGFGFCAVKNNEILCWCTMEYLSDSLVCGIGVETIHNAQNQGIASVVSTAFLKKCFQKKIIPHWDCWKSNIPSIKLANKLGFDLMSKYQILSISK